jgi:hypothetical protein
MSFLKKIFVSAKSENYMAKLVKELAELNKKLKEVKPGQSVKAKSKFLANKKVIDDLKKAEGLLKTNFNKAATLISNIPYYIVSFREGEEFKPKAKYKYYGTDDVYSETDSLRHYIRMIDLSGGGQVGKGELWNNIMVLK